MSRKKPTPLRIVCYECAETLSSQYVDTLRGNDPLLCAKCRVTSRAQEQAELVELRVRLVGAVRSCATCLGAKVIETFNGAHGRFEYPPCVACDGRGHIPA